MIVSTASIARARERGVGEVADRVGAEQDEHPDLAVGRRPQDALRVEARRIRDAAPPLGEPGAARVERRAAGQEPGREPGVERAVHVAAAQRRQEPHVVHSGKLGGRADDGVGGGRDVAAPDDDHDRTGRGPRSRA